MPPPREAEARRQPVRHQGTWTLRPNGVVRAAVGDSPQQCHPTLSESDLLRSVQLHFPYREARVLNASMRDDPDWGDPADVTGGFTCSP